MIHAQRSLLLAIFLMGTSYMAQAGIIRMGCTAAFLAVACRATWVIAKGHVETKESNNIPATVKIGNIEATLNVGYNWLHDFDKRVIECWKKAQKIVTIKKQ